MILNHTHFTNHNTTFISLPLNVPQSPLKAFSFGYQCPISGIHTHKRLTGTSQVITLLVKSEGYDGTRGRDDDKRSVKANFPKMDTRVRGGLPTSY